jgi:hypothetical protein
MDGWLSTLHRSNRPLLAGPFAGDLCFCLALLEILAVALLVFLVATY